MKVTKQALSDLMSETLLELAGARLRSSSLFLQG